MSEILTETLVDTLKMLTFLFGAYLLLEYVEHRAADRLARALAGAKSGVLGGALLGCLPQCGFSVAAANLYSGGLISAGTLLAVFLSTSDEALPILLAQPEGAPLVGRLLLVKILIALAAGLAMDTFSKGQRSGCGDLHRDCGEDASEQGGVLRAALRHTAEVFLFLLIVTLALNLVISWLGEQRLGALNTQCVRVLPHVHAAAALEHAREPGAAQPQAGERGAHGVRIGEVQLYQLPGARRRAGVGVVVRHVGAAALARPVPGGLSLGGGVEILYVLRPGRP